MFFPIGMFPVIMIAAATVFFDPGWPRRWLRLLARAFARPLAPVPVPVPKHAPAVTWPHRLALAGFAAFALVQVVMPCRRTTSPSAPSPNAWLDLPHALGQAPGRPRTRSS
jgi:hypothetical protein